MPVGNLLQKASQRHAFSGVKTSARFFIVIARDTVFFIGPRVLRVSLLIVLHSSVSVTGHFHSADICIFEEIAMQATLIFHESSYKHGP